MTVTPLLELRGVRKSFGDVEAVAGVSAAFERGQYVCILGPSGCGKTTLLRVVAGFEEPDGGTLLLEGVPLDGVPPERRDLNVVFQSYALFPHLDVRENVAFGPRMKRLPKGEIQARVDAALALVRLEALGGRRPSQLSGGQQQRVALARAIVNRPKVLLLDEPLSALDRSLRADMQEELKALQRETGLTFLHVTHDQGEALSLSDRLVVMKDGRFAQVGPPREIYERPRSRFVAEFLGASNLIEGEGDGPGRVRTSGGLVLTVADATTSGPVLLSVRPEAVELEPEGAAGALTYPHIAPNRFDGDVEAVAFAGSAVECRIRVSGHTLRALVPARAGAEVRPGERVRVRIPPEALVPLAPEEGETR